MFRFSRGKILPLFLAARMTIAELAKKAGVSHQTAQKAINGEAVRAVIIEKIAEALGVEAMKYLEHPRDIEKGVM